MKIKTGKCLPNGNKWPAGAVAGLESIPFRREPFTGPPKAQDG
jgi:hypothetical protein